MFSGPRQTIREISIVTTASNTMILEAGFVEETSEEVFNKKLRELNIADESV